MYEIDYTKLDAVVGMTKRSFPSTASLAIRFDRIQRALPMEHVTQGYLILDAIQEEMTSRNGRRIHEMYRLNEWFREYLDEVETQEVKNKSEEIAKILEKEEARRRAYVMRFDFESPERAAERLRQSFQLLFFCLL
jgi:hypothetical protein